MELSLNLATMLAKEIQDAVVEYKSVYSHSPMYLHLPKSYVALLNRVGYTQYPYGRGIVPIVEAIYEMLTPTGCHYRGHVFDMMLLSNPRLIDSMSLSNHIVNTPDDGSRTLLKEIKIHEQFSRSTRKAKTSAR